MVRQSQINLNAVYFVSSLVSSFVIIVVLAFPLVANARSAKDMSNASYMQSQIRKANSLAKSGKNDKARAVAAALLATATTSDQCLSAAEATQKYGRILDNVRRDCLSKAIELAKGRDQLMQVAAKARQEQCYDMAKAAMDAVVATASTKEDLFELANKCCSMTMPDVAHLALEKAYGQNEKNNADLIAFAKQAKLDEFDDLTRKAIIELINDESDCQELCSLYTEIEPFEMRDLDREVLKKAVAHVQTIDDCKAVFDRAKRCHQQDIANLAAYRGRRMVLLEQVKTDKEAYQKQLEAWRSGQVDVQEQKAADDLAKNKTNPVAPDF